MSTISQNRAEEIRKLLTRAMVSTAVDSRKPIESAYDALLRPDTIEGTVCKCDGAFLTLLRWDVNQDRDSWSWHAVIGVQGPLPYDEGCWDEQAILASMREGFGIHCSGEGSSGAGRPFANRPWIQYLGAPTRTLIVTQSGGLDV